MGRREFEIEVVHLEGFGKERKTRIVDVSR
jgi:hypothetical protein